MFIDKAVIKIKAGDGGNGAVAFHREKYVASGGPDGGDGGKGGSVILRGNSQYWPLIHLKYARHVFAKDGESGGGSRMSGKTAADQIIEVPLGTVARDAETGEIVGEVTEHGEELVLLKGGRGGLGNTQDIAVGQTDGGIIGVDFHGGGMTGALCRTVTDGIHNLLSGGMILHQQRVSLTNTKCPSDFFRNNNTTQIINSSHKTSCGTQNRQALLIVADDFDRYASLRSLHRPPDALATSPVAFIYK